MLLESYSEHMTQEHCTQLFLRSHVSSDVRVTVCVRLSKEQVYTPRSLLSRLDILRRLTTHVPYSQLRRPKEMKGSDPSGLILWPLSLHSMRFASSVSRSTYPASWHCKVTELWPSIEIVSSTAVSIPVRRVWT